MLNRCQCLLLAAAAAWCGAAQAQTPPRENDGTTPSSATDSPTVRAAIDPETGLLIEAPTAKTQTSAQQLDAKPQPQLKSVILPDGSEMIDLQGTLQMETKVRRDPSGSLHADCAQSHPHPVPQAHPTQVVPAPKTDSR